MAAAGGAMGAVGGAMMGAGGAGMTGPGQKPTIRNPVMTMLMTFIPIYGIIVYYGMIKELKNFTQDPGFFMWGWLIPCFNFYWMLLLLPQQVTKAKQMAGSPKPARGIIFYWFIGPYALAADLNEVADPNWTG